MDCISVSLESHTTSL